MFVHTVTRCSDRSLPSSMGRKEGDSAPSAGMPSSSALSKICQAPSYFTNVDDKNKMHSCGNRVVRLKTEEGKFELNINACTCPQALAPPALAISVIDDSHGSNHCQLQLRVECSAIRQWIVVEGCKVCCENAERFLVQHVEATIAFVEPRWATTCESTLYNQTKLSRQVC